MKIKNLESIRSLIVEINAENIILDSDIAGLYGVKTRDINKAVKNNPDKFPEGYLFELTKQEKIELVEKFHRFGRLKHSTVNPKAFTEKGLYMLATVLKSDKATQTTIAIYRNICQNQGVIKECFCIDECERRTLKKSDYEKKRWNYC